jgi:SAM-dependent methyltransferase
MLRKLVDRIGLLTHFLSSSRRRGIVRTLRISFNEIWYERKFGVATGFVIPVGRLDFNEADRLHAGPYFPSSYLFLHEALAAGPLDCRNQVFVDLGCGMGRALLFASTLPFARVIGVELSPSLCEIASKNLQRYYALHNKSRPQWTIVNVDAALFRIPEDATIFYMFNPFDAVVVGKVLDNILSSVRAAPRRVYLVYANPIHERLVRDRGLKKIAPPSADYVIYSYQL